MTKLTKSLLALTLGTTFGATTALGQQPPFLNGIINLNELGSGTLSFTTSDGFNVVGYLNGSLGVDPISHMTTLCYPLSGLGFVPVEGDIVLVESPTEAISDVIRFTQTNLYFFSDLEPGDPNPDLADVGIPPLQGVYVLNVLEVGPDDGPGPEGMNGASYTPLPGQPGYDPSGTWPGLTYNLISDVPEPGSLSLLLAGALLWGFRTLRRKSQV